MGARRDGDGGTGRRRTPRTSGAGGRASGRGSSSSGERGGHRDRRRDAERDTPATGGPKRSRQRDAQTGGFGPFAKSSKATRRRSTAPIEPREPTEPRGRAGLRVVRGTGAGQEPRHAAKTQPRDAAKARAGRSTAGRPGRGTRRGGAEPVEVRDEILRLGGRRGERLYEQVVRAGDALARDRERDALRLLRPVRDEIPRAASVRELLGLALYRSGRFAEAARELEVFVELTGDVAQHPVLMDCYRASRAYARVEELWRELGEASPSAELVTEGRIVFAGTLADRSRIDEAIRLLARRASSPRRVREHHLRVWYALADLEERAGNLPRARSLFEQVRRHEADFADVAERIAALG